MSQFLQAVINGVAVASVYALIAVGFVIIYKSMQVLSFAQPGLMLFGAWWVVYFAGRPAWGFNWYLAILIAVAIVALTGVGIERGLLRPMVGKPVFAVAIMTIGIDVVLRVTTGNLLGTDVNSSGDPFGLNLFIGPKEGIIPGRFELGDLILNERRFAGIVAAIVLVTGLLLFFRYTRTGLAMRATAFDQEVALTQGVSVPAVFALSWAFAAVLAMVGGLFISPDTGQLSSTQFAFALRALPVVVIGGLDSIGGAVVAALIVGIAEQLTVTYNISHLSFLGKNFALIVPYLVMFIVLLVRPYGLFGTREVERV